MIIFDVVEVIRDSMKNQGFDKRNFIEILNSKRRGTTMSNLVARDLEYLEATKSTKTTEQYQEELKTIVENFGKDIGIEMNLIYTDEVHMPKDSKGKGGAARRENDGKLVAHVDVTKNETTSDLLGTVFEEVAHLIDLQAGRKHETIAEEQQRGEHGLETLGRPIGNYFKDKYEETSTDFTNAQIDTEDYTNVDGETVGNYYSHSEDEAGIRTLEIKELLSPLKSKNLSIEEKREILSQYDKIVSINQILARGKLKSPYEGIYILGSDMPEYLKGILKKDNLYLPDFDYTAWSRIKNREEYKKMQNKLIQNGEILAKEYLKIHPYLEKNNQLKNVIQEVSNPKSKNESKRDSRLQTSEKFVGSEEVDIKKRKEKNKNIPDLLNSMEFALGTSSMIGTLVFNKVKNDDGSIELTVKLRYNLTDSFEKVYGKYGLEYGKPYYMIGKKEYHTYKFKSYFKNGKEYLDYIRSLK